MNPRFCAYKKISTRSFGGAQQHIASAVVVLAAALVCKHKIKREAVQIESDRTLHEFAQSFA